MSLNRVLTDVDRELYASVINEMFTHCPAAMARKIPRANVQQAFAFELIRALVPKSADLLCAGSHEDTASKSLVNLGYSVVEVDPVVNYDLGTFRASTTKKFDVVFSVSVIEHVQEDEVFVDDMCSLLKPGGYGVLTCDFSSEYKPGDRLPSSSSVRLYTEHDLSVRLRGVIESNHCSFLDTPDWSAAPDFKCNGCLYSFATLVFKEGYDL